MDASPRDSELIGRRSRRYLGACTAHQFESDRPLLTGFGFVAPEPEEIESNVEALMDLFALAVVAAAQHELSGCRNFRGAFEQPSQFLQQGLVHFERESSAGVGEQKIYIRTEFPRHSEDLFLWVDLVRSPGVALGGRNRA